jgi:hypothetical protein
MGWTSNVTVGEADFVVSEMPVAFDDHGLLRGAAGVMW